MGKKVISFRFNFHNKLREEVKGNKKFEGELLDLITINKKHYLITKNDKIDVREIIHDIYSDGNSVIYANQEKSIECVGLEKIFNDKHVMQKINKGVSPLYILLDIKVNVNRSELMKELGNIVICIKPHVFEGARDIMLKYSNKSFYEMCLELEYEKENKVVNKYGL